MNYFDEIEFAENPEPRSPIIFLLDTSLSMDGAPINALNQGLQVFQTDIQKDDLARRRVEVATVTFGNGGVQTIQDFVTADQFQAPTLTAGGSTPMGKAINRALDMLRDRKDMYNKNGIAYYRPWIFMITDGAPDESPEQPSDERWHDAAQRIQNEEAAKSVAFFAVGVAGADMDRLMNIAVRRPLKLRGLSFIEMFKWLAQSQKRVSNSRVGEQIPLPPYHKWAAPFEEWVVQGK
jgi:uncharacterized protein YegL